MMFGLDGDVEMREMEVVELKWDEGAKGGVGMDYELGGSQLLWFW